MVLQSKHQSVLAFAIPILLIIVVALLSRFIILSDQNQLFYNAVTIDLVFTIPFIYFLLIRKKNIPKTTTVPLFVIGILPASYLVPQQYQSLLNVIKSWVVPIVEVSVLIFIILSVRKAIKAYKANKTGSFDFFTTLKTTASEVLSKRFSQFFAMEIGTVYYGFFHWKKITLKPNQYTYHKNTGTVTMLGAFIFIIVIETIALHLLLSKWNTTVAWVLTILSIYSGIQILGFLKSMSKRPYTIEANTLYLRYGIMSEAVIPINLIETIELSTQEMEFKGDIRKLSPLGGMESHNMMIILREKLTLTGLYGIKKEYKTLAFNVDEKVEFKKQIEGLLNKN